MTTHTGSLPKNLTPLTYGFIMRKMARAMRLQIVDLIPAAQFEVRDADGALVNPAGTCADTLNFLHAYAEGYYGQD